MKTEVKTDTQQRHSYYPIKSAARSMSKMTGAVASEANKVHDHLEKQP